MAFGKPDSTSGGTQTTSSEPPAYLAPYLTQAAGAASELYGQGGPEQYPGSTVVPFSPQTEASLAGTTARATAGSPVVAAGQNFVQQGLSTPVTSQFGGATNPYLDAQFNMAADRTQNRLTSEFARSGRNVDAAAPARAGMLADLAAQIYGPAYENERSRQLSDLTSQRSNQAGLLSHVNPLAQSDYTDLAALGGVGAQVEDLAGRTQQDAATRYGYEQQRPETALNQYIARITGQNTGGTTTQTLPDVYRNPAAGALGGAFAGGSMFGTPWGALLGAGLGLL